MIRRKTWDENIGQIANYIFEHGFIFDSLYDVYDAWANYSREFCTEWLCVADNTLEMFLVYLDKEVKEEA